MAKKERKTRKPTRRNKAKAGYRARFGDHILQSWTVDALPIVNRLLQRMRLEEILQQHLPPDDPRVDVPTVRCLLLLVRNVLLSREPLYGLGEWAEQYAPDLLGFTQRQVTDDTTHQETWELLRQLTGRKDFLYVADCKLATSKNLQYIVNRGGRFISLLPRTRKENTEFRRRLVDAPDKVAWKHVKDILGKDDEIIDRVKVCGESLESKEGHRLHWYHSCRKQERDAASRQKSIERALRELRELERRLKSPRTRFRQRPKVEEAVSEILRVTCSGAWVQVVTEAVEEEFYKQAKPGRPSKKTKYVREVRERFQLSITVDQSQVATDQASDGMFPLITSEQDMSAADVLAAYKRQPIIEKRFSQFKTDFSVAPVYLKEISRIHSLLCIYFLALCVQTLLERELRRAMVAADLESLPLYPEDHP